MGSAPAPTIPGIPTVPMSHAASPPTAPPGLQMPRPQLRAITELAPPSQLDIDWSPVLTRNNERIIKLGNLNVISSPAANSPASKGGEEASKKFSRFFGGATTKKRQRLVMITSSARVILAAAGGDEKKAKLELNLLAAGTSCKPVQDSKTGLTAFSINTVSFTVSAPMTRKLTASQRDKNFSFEDPRATTSDPEGSKYSTQEWLEAIDRAKEVAQSQAIANSYSGESQYGDLASTMSSPTSASGGDGGVEQQSMHSGRNTLRKEQGDNESVKSRKPRFSKRHSKSGLAAVF
jgi:3-phosphoinositide dependent protein kinase-1